MIKTDCKIALKKISATMDIDKMINLLVDSVCNVCADNITKKIKEINNEH